MSLKPALLANLAKERGPCMYKKLRLLTCGKRIGVIPSSSTKGKSPFIKIEALYVTRTLEVVPWGLQGCHLSLVPVKTNEKYDLPFRVGLREA